MPDPFTSKRSREFYSNRIEQAIQYISLNLSSSPDLAQAAQAAGFSPFHFHRIFTALTGETPRDFTNRLQVEKAANLLVKSPSLSITEIAFACGFSSPSTFARSFKKYFGFSASQYVAQNASSGRPAWVIARVKVGELASEGIPPVRICRMPALHLACFMSRKGYGRDSIHEVWGRLFTWAQGRGLLTLKALLVAVSYDDPEITPAHKCRYYACITIPENIKNDSRAVVMDFPQCLCAVCRMECNAEEIQPMFRRLYRDWLPESGYLPADYPPYEVYYDAPETNPAGRYILDICIPLIPIE